MVPLSPLPCLFVHFGTTLVLREPLLPRGVRTIRLRRSVSATTIISLSRNCAVIGLQELARKERELRELEERTRAQDEERRLLLEVVLVIRKEAPFLPSPYLARLPLPLRPACSLHRRATLIARCH